MTHTQETAQALTPAEALAHAFTHALGKLGQRHAGTLERACALVENGGVRHYDTGSWYAQRETDKEEWLVNGVCLCEEARTAVEHLCTHRLAVGLAKKCEQLLAHGLPPVAEVLEPPPIVLPEAVGEAEAAPRVRQEPDAWQREDAALPSATQAGLVQVVQACVREALAGLKPGLPEAPASINLRMMIGGRDCQLTLRDTDEDRLLVRLDRLLAKHPLPEATLPEAPPSHAAPGQAGEPGEQRVDWCYTCEEQMTRKKDDKSGDVWHFHKVNGLYCHGYGPGVKRPRS